MQSSFCKLLKIKRQKENGQEFILTAIGGGGRDRTSDLWVMSPMSYHCSTPQYLHVQRYAHLFN